MIVPALLVWLYVRTAAAADESTSIAMTPASYNCEELAPNYQVRWKLSDDRSQIDIELLGLIEEDGYMSFGVSGNATKAQMVGGDVVVADYWGGAPRAMDYLMSDKDLCQNDTSTGVCPEDLSTNGFVNDVLGNSVTGTRNNEQGLTLVRYRRPASMVSNVNETVGDWQVPVDKAINIDAGGLTTVIWALGSIDTASGHPSYQFFGVSRDLFQFEFGRDPVVDNCVAMVNETSVAPDNSQGDGSMDDETSNRGGDGVENNDQNRQVNPFVRPVLTEVVEFRANIGPSGGPRGYTSISGGRTSNDTAWYINDILVPVIELRRGSTYSFYVNGGNDPAQASTEGGYHPLYLTTSISGGYAQKSSSERGSETVLGGIRMNGQGGDVVEFEPTAFGPLCRYYETNASPAAASGGYFEYFSSLNTSCASNTNIANEAGLLEFTPDQETPGLIYYQSVEQENLGWEIHVIDADAPSILKVNCENFGLTPLQLTSELTFHSIIDPIRGTIQIKLVLNALAWMAMAFTDGRPGMVGAEAVIGFPSADPNSPSAPTKFHMNSKTGDGVVPMAAEQQTLMNATIAQTDTQTILQFTKFLSEEGEHPIFSDRPNTFLFAHGANNGAGPHISYGSFEVLPNHCTVYIKDELQNGFALNQQGAEAGVEVVDLQRKLWVAHGACAAIAWGILVPLAIGASLIRKVLVQVLGLSEGAWFQLHRVLNFLAAALTVAAFAIGVRAINESTANGADPDHFNGDITMHRRVGLIIFLLTLMQAINGMLRPPHHSKTHARGARSSSTTTTGSGNKNNEKTQEFSGELSRTIRAETEHTENGDVGSPTGNHHSKQETNSDQNNDDDQDGSTDGNEKSMLRTIWEIFHRLLGFSLLGLALWQVQNGLGIFATRFDEENTDTIFWIVVSCIAGSIGVIVVFGRLVLP
ncbi:hypothetical protein ACA910_003619 [Epithemia clementina (nom. ined.)]